MLNRYGVGALCVVVGVLAPERASAQEPALSDRFERASPSLVIEEEPAAPGVGASGQSSVWETAAVGAGVGALVAGTAAYVLYPNAIDPWLTRGPHTALIAVEGALVGGGIGVLFALIKRRTSDSESETSAADRKRLAPTHPAAAPE